MLYGFKRRVVLALMVAMVAASPLGAQQSSTPQNGAEQLLTAAWDSTLSARKLADQIYEQHMPADGQLTHAYTLTLIKQRRYPEALRTTRELLTNAGEDLQLRWTEIWLLLVNREHEAALQRSVALLPLIQQDQQAALALETVKSLGTVIGFLEGPANRKIAATTLDQQVSKMVATFNEKQLESFQQARQKILDDFARRQQETAIADTQEQQQEAAQRELERVQVERDQIRLANEAAQLEDRQRELEAEIRENASQVRQREAEARSRALQLADEVGFLRSRLLLVEADIARLDEQIAKTTDPAARAILIAQRDDLIQLQRFQFADLRGLERQLANANQNLRMARNDRIRQDHQAAESTAALARSKRALKKERAKTNRRESDLTSPSDKSSARSRVERKKSASWSTYLPYPLEVERQRVLRLIRAA